MKLPKTTIGMGFFLLNRFPSKNLLWVSSSIFLNLDSINLFCVPLTKMLLLLIKKLKVKRTFKCYTVCKVCTIEAHENRKLTEAAIFFWYEVAERWQSPANYQLKCWVKHIRVYMQSILIEFFIILGGGIEQSSKWSQQHWTLNFKKLTGWEVFLVREYA